MESHPSPPSVAPFNVPTNDPLERDALAREQELVRTAAHLVADPALGISRVTVCGPTGVHVVELSAADEELPPNVTSLRPAVLAPWKPSAPGRGTGALGWLRHALARGRGAA